MDCNQEKTNGHLLIMHYGVEHNISMELYNKSQIQATRSRDPRACTTKDNNDRRKEGKYPKRADIRFCFKAVDFLCISIYKQFTLKVLNTAYRSPYLIP